MFENDLNSFQYDGYNPKRRQKSSPGINFVPQKGSALVRKGIFAFFLQFTVI
jgi:hypothetical protein